MAVFFATVLIMGFAHHRKAKEKLALESELVLVRDSLDRVRTEASQVDVLETFLDVQAKDVKFTNMSPRGPGGCRKAEQGGNLFKGLHGALGKIIDLEVMLNRNRVGNAIRVAGKTSSIKEHFAVGPQRQEWWFTFFLYICAINYLK